MIKITVRGIVTGSKKAKKHAKIDHECPFCGCVIFGNGGWSSHFKKEMLACMPDIPKSTPITIVRAEFFYRKSVGLVSYD